MNFEDLSRIKRAEFLARLSLLEQFIAQEAHVTQVRSRGWDAKESERRLELLRESHRLYFSALLRELGDGVLKPEQDSSS